MFFKTKNWTLKVIIAAPYLILLLIFIVPWFRLDLSQQVIERFSDKLVHFLIFGLYASSQIIKHLALFSSPTNRQKLSLIFQASFIAAFDEIMQSFISFRNGDFYDFIADLLGIIIFTVITSHNLIIKKLEPLIKK